MLKIERSWDQKVILSLSGRIEMDDVNELQRLLNLESPGDGIALDLQDVTLIDRDAVKFLARWENANVKLERCPAYIREWIDAERGRHNRIDDRPEGKGTITNGF
jgi:ABC-type transporter Mla MlaB component